MAEGLAGHIRVPNLPWAKLKAGPHWYEGPDDPARAYMLEHYGEDKFSRPVMNAGDVVIFADHIYHQTYVTPDMKLSRASIDIRITMRGQGRGMDARADGKLRQYGPFTISAAVRAS